MLVRSDNLEKWVLPSDMEKKTQFVMRRYARLSWSPPYAIVVVEKLRISQLTINRLCGGVPAHILL
jgi:hypothetical protein